MIRTKEEFIEYVSTMELQNLSGREDFQEAFEIGIAAAYDQIVEDRKLSNVSICGDCEGKGYIFYQNGAAWIKANCSTCNS